MLFTLVMEECGEVLKEASKCIRFTPNHKYGSTSNLERMNTELSDLMCVIELLEKELGFTFEKRPNKSKLERIEKYLELSSSMGTLQGKARRAI